jgi:hypothetical protein
MTPTSDITSEPQPPLSDWELKSQAHARLEAEVFKQNKAALLDALTLTGITTVVVSFDGYGDSGQIEHVKARSATRRPACTPARSKSSKPYGAKPS